MDTDQQQSASQHISWHTAFVQAIRFELKDYQDVLEFYPECSA